jgi:hypothetical protein
LEFSCLKKAMVLSFVWAIPEINFGDCHFFKPDNEKEFLQAFSEIFNWKINNYSYNKHLTVDKMLQQYEDLYSQVVN